MSIGNMATACLAVAVAGAEAGASDTWTVHDTDRYQKDADRKSWKRLPEVLKEELKWRYRLQGDKHENK